MPVSPGQASSQLVGTWLRCSAASIAGGGSADVGVQILPDGTWALLGQGAAGSLVVLTGPVDSGTWRVNALPTATALQALEVTFQPAAAAGIRPPFRTEFAAGPPERVEFAPVTSASTAPVTADYVRTTQSASPERPPPLQPASAAQAAP